MKRFIFALLATILIASGAAVAQTDATGQTQDPATGARTTTLPGTNNNLNNQVESHSTTGTYVAKPNATTTETTPASEPVETMEQNDKGTVTPGATTPTYGTGATTAPTATTDTGVADTGDSLPATGSELPLIGASGLLALAAAAGLRLRRV